MMAAPQCVDDALFSELLDEALGNTERSAKDSDVFAQEEDIRVTAHLFTECLADGIEVRDDGH
jgi:hypothetical protein